MFDRDLAAAGRVIGNEPGDVVLKAQLALFRQLQDGHGGELLGDRTDLEYGSNVQGHVELHIRQSECPGVDHTAIACDQNGRARLCLLYTSDAADERSSVDL